MSRYQQLCDGDLTYPSGQSLEKYGTGTVMTLNYDILGFACTTDTGNYLYSEIYAISTNGSEYYVDVFNNTNGLIDFLIGISVCCCCFCLRLCAKAP